MPEQERNLIKNILNNMIEKAERVRNPRYEKPHYMRLILQALGSGVRYANLDEALSANGAAYNKLKLTTSSWPMIAGEIKHTYFNENLEKILLSKLNQEDIQVLIEFINKRLRIR
ncbi:MAG: hypothetical protein H3Z52_07660 [archaeon]|nr:hypothetical protein [archaeon]